jgi:hypothetical protein
VTEPDLDELVARARRERPAPGALQAVARSLRVPFVAMPVAAVVVPSTALGSVVAKVGLSRLALLGWGTGSAVAVTGVVAAVALQQPAPPPSPLPPPPSAKHAEMPQPILEPSSPPPPAVPAPSVEHRAPPGPATWDEPQLIERARKALGSDPRRALLLTQEHQRRFPAGALGVERDVIALEALARSGQTAEARRRALRFEKRYPNSIHSPQVRALLARLETPKP